MNNKYIKYININFVWQVLKMISKLNETHCPAHLNFFVTSVKLLIQGVFWLL